MDCRLGSLRRTEWKAAACGWRSTASTTFRQRSRGWPSLRLLLAVPLSASLGRLECGGGSPSAWQCVSQKPLRFRQRLTSAACHMRIHNSAWYAPIPARSRLAPTALHDSLSPEGKPSKGLGAAHVLNVTSKRQDKPSPEDLMGASLSGLAGPFDVAPWLLSCLGAPEDCFLPCRCGHS